MSINMRIWLLITFFILLFCKGYSQSCSSPIIIDFSTKTDTSVTQTGSRSGACCGGSNCIVFLVKINPGTNLLTFNPGQITGSGYYTVDCGPLIPTGTPVCITGKTSATISFCKPGANAVQYTITASSGIQPSPNLTLRQGCTGSMSVAGLISSSATWTSVYPGTAGAYNSYLSSTSGADTVSVTPQVGAPAYIDYKVSGNSACGITNSATIRVYVFPPLTVSINPSSPAICSGNPVTLTANPSGGNPAYTYLWNTGATTASINVSTTGTYTVSVNDQSSSCGAVTQQVTVTAFTPVAPTAPPVSICTGSTATLTATAPGGPYQWYDAAVNGNQLSANASYTTPALTTNTTYYVQTTNGGCTSSRTAVVVTVNPLPPMPTISSH